MAGRDLQMRRTTVKTRLRVLRSMIVMIAFMVLLVPVQADSPAAPSDVVVKDVPNDNGTSLNVEWHLSPDDAKDSKTPVARYQVVRMGMRIPSSLEILQGKAKGEIPVVLDRTEIAAGTNHMVSKDCDPHSDYVFVVVAIGQDGQESRGLMSEKARPVINWFDTAKTSFAAIVVAICLAVIVCTEIARRGRPFYVRPIAGLQAIEEAVGRATEMGKPLLFVPGIEDVKEIDTVAGLMVLSRVAKTAAEYDTPLEVPTTRTLVMTAAREAVQAASLIVGRPDYYNEERIHYVTEEQFGYVASVCGWMQREKPAACFFLGKFFAESLILAETGNAVGAIQIAGTAETTQLPFFVAACDYTLLGEELFAASAYLSGEPAQLGMLKGQDLGKLAAVVLIVVGCVLATWDSISPARDVQGKPLPGRAEILTKGVLNK